MSIQEVAGIDTGCDDQYLSLQEGVCVDLSIPGAIPAWRGAPAENLLDPTPDLFPATVCKSRRRDEKSCHCARGLDVLDYGYDRQPRGNCTRYVES